MAGGGALVDKALAQKKTETDIAATQAGTRKTTAEAQRQEYINKAIEAQQTAQQTGVHPVDAVFPASLDQQINASYHHTYDSLKAQPPDENGRHPAAEQLLATAANHAAQVAMANNPLVRQGKANEAAATEAATAPIKINEAVGTQRALYGGNPAFANVAPHLQVPAITAAQKAGSEYTNAVSAAQEMSDLLNEARNGNKLAYAYAPTTGVLTINSANGTKRMNMAEVHQYSSAGNLVDNVEGWLMKHATGASIPSDILDAMEQVHGTMLNGAKTKYANEVNLINRNYGAGIDPNDLLSTTKTPNMTSLSTGHKVGDTVALKNGKQGTISKIYPKGTFDIQ